MFSILPFGGYCPAGAGAGSVAVVPALSAAASAAASASMSISCASGPAAPLIEAQVTEPAPAQASVELPPADEPEAAPDDLDPVLTAIDDFGAGE